MADAQSWLAAPYTYTTAKCLSSHVRALQVSTSDRASLPCDVSRCDSSPPPPVADGVR